MTPSISMEAGGPAVRLSGFARSREGKAGFRKAGLAVLLMSVTALGGCAHPFIPPDINYDNAVPAKLSIDPPPPVKIVELPKPLPLPGQLKPLNTGKPVPEAPDPTARVNQANAAARSQSQITKLYIHTSHFIGLMGRLSQTLPPVAFPSVIDFT